MVNMKGIVKIGSLWIMVVVILFMWRVYDIGLTITTDTMDNQSMINPHPFPIIDMLFSLVWGGSFLIAIVVTAIYLYSEGKGEYE